MDEFWLQSSYVQPQYAPGPYIDSYLVRASVVPIPPAVWLFGSGLIGLIGVARRKVCRATEKRSIRDARSYPISSFRWHKYLRRFHFSLSSYREWLTFVHTTKRFQYAFLITGKAHLLPIYSSYISNTTTSCLYV